MKPHCSQLLRFLIRKFHDPPVLKEGVGKQTNRNCLVTAKHLLTTKTIILPRCIANSLHHIRYFEIIVFVHSTIRFVAAYSTLDGVNNCHCI
jgi:hypothetical protein